MPPLNSNKCAVRLENIRQEQRKTRSERNQPAPFSCYSRIGHCRYAPAGAIFGPGHVEDSDRGEWAAYAGRLYWSVVRGTAARGPVFLLGRECRTLPGCG